MIKNFFLILIFFSFINCSFDTKSGFWTQEKKTIKTSSEKILFENDEINENEFNINLILKLGLKTKKNNVQNGNNIGVSNIKSELKNISKYDFRKIKYFDQFEPELTFINNDLVFFDKNGSVIRFSEEGEIVWKVNYYTKKEKKNQPILRITKRNNKLLITDSFSKIYLLDAINGNLIWSTEHKVNFISEIKIDEDRVFVLDALNTFNCISLIDGKILWEFRGEEQLINSQKLKSVVYDDDKVIFNNVQNKIIALNKFNGNLIWITPTISFEEGFQSYLINTSDLVIDNDNLFLSNTSNNFYSLDINTGLIKWTQKISSSSKPVIIDNVIFTIASNKYLYIIEKKDGNIIRITDFTKGLKKKKKERLKTTGFIVSEDKIYVSTNLGYLIVINVGDGQRDDIYKISRGEISKPYTNNSNLYLIKNNQIIKMN